MSFENAPVTHKRYGDGKVKSLVGPALTIHFQQYGTRTFRFPQIFDEEMTTTDEMLLSALAEACAALK